MDKRILNELGDISWGLFVKKVEVSNFGRDVSLYVLYDPTTDEYDFKIILSDCVRQIWETFVDAFELPEIEHPYGADVIDIRLGQNDYKENLTILTQLFELSISYKNLEIVRP
jgi:hypothetical protein